MKKNSSSERKRAAPRGRSFLPGNKAAAKAPELRRVMLTVSIAPETLQLLDALVRESGLSRGRIVDSAVSALAGAAERTASASSGATLQMRRQLRGRNRV